MIRYIDSRTATAISITGTYTLYKRASFVPRVAAAAYTLLRYDYAHVLLCLSVVIRGGSNRRRDQLGGHLVETAAGMRRRFTIARQ